MTPFVIAATVIAISATLAAIDIAVVILHHKLASTSRLATGPTHPTWEGAGLPGRSGSTVGHARDLPPDGPHRLGVGRGASSIDLVSPFG